MDTPSSFKFQTALEVVSLFPSWSRPSKIRLNTNGNLRACASARIFPKAKDHERRCSSLQGLEVVTRLFHAPSWGQIVHCKQQSLSLSNAVQSLHVCLVLTQEQSHVAGTGVWHKWRDVTTRKELKERAGVSRQRFFWGGEERREERKGEEKGGTE